MSFADVTISKRHFFVEGNMKKYDIAAYVWPSYTGDEPRARIFGKKDTESGRLSGRCSRNMKDIFGPVSRFGDM